MRYYLMPLVAATGDAAIHWLRTALPLELAIHNRPSRPHTAGNQGFALSLMLPRERVFVEAWVQPDVRDFPFDELDARPFLRLRITEQSQALIAALDACVMEAQGWIGTLSNTYVGGPRQRTVYVARYEKACIPQTEAIARLRDTNPLVQRVSPDQLAALYTAETGAEADPVTLPDGRPGLCLWHPTFSEPAEQAA